MTFVVEFSARSEQTPGDSIDQRALDLVRREVPPLERIQSTRAQTPTTPPPPLTVERGDDGGYIASDSVGVAYGMGGTAAEAISDWERLAREHLADLRRAEPALHVRMRAQLVFLSRLFG